MSTPKILISACLVGEPVRYDGKSNLIDHALISKWQSQGILLPICPEVIGGLKTPRPPAEIQLNGSLQTQQGIDVTAEFQRGAELTLQKALKHNIKIAILTEKSPSCGSQLIYDGAFARKLIKGQGVTAKLLEKHGIKVFNQFELAEAEDHLKATALNDPNIKRKQ